VNRRLDAARERVAMLEREVETLLARRALWRDRCLYERQEKAALEAIHDEVVEANRKQVRDLRSLADRIVALTAEIGRLKDGAALVPAATAERAMGEADRLRVEVNLVAGLALGVGVELLRLGRIGIGYPAAKILDEVRRIRGLLEASSVLRRYGEITLGEAPVPATAPGVPAGADGSPT
jgi:hypothetical protein